MHGLHREAITLDIEIRKCLFVDEPDERSKALLPVDRRIGQRVGIDPFRRKINGVGSPRTTVSMR